MKRIILMAAIICFGFGACNTEDDILTSQVPSEVINAFKAEFPDAMDVDWEKKSEDYEADFEIQNIDHQVLINVDGMLLKHKYDILQSELPSEVLEEIRSFYPDNSIDDIEILEMDDQLYYQVEYDGDFLDKKKIFDQTGKEVENIDYWD